MVDSQVASFNLLNIVWVLGAAFIAVVAYMGHGYQQIGTRYKNALNISSIYIIEERDIEKDPIKHAQLMLDEVKKVFVSDGWYSEIATNKLKVDSKPIDGPLSVYKAPIQRAFTNVSCKSAQELFKFMVSPDGFAVIDPITPKEEHLRAPDVSYKWKKGRLEVAVAKVPLPWPFKPREFVVLNAIDDTTRTFVSKSILPPKKLLDTNATNPKAVRALNTFGLQIDDILGANKKPSGECKVSSIDFAAGIVGDLRLQHYVNAVLFYPGLFQRLEDALAKNNETVSK